MGRGSASRSALLPFVPLYRLALAFRERRLASGSEPVRGLRLPVISIGNLSTGGSGKTPLTIALAKALTARGFSVDVLSRGYGRISRTAVRVDPAGTAEEYGDEPLLIARAAQVPVYVAPQRYDAGRLAESQFPTDALTEGALKGHDISGAESSSSSNIGSFAPEGSPPRLHLLDDGFQHRQLHRGTDILILSRADLYDRLLPAGNLREPFAAFHRAHILAIPADDPVFESLLRARGWRGPVWHIRRRMEIPSLPGPVLAFCGIARPAQFFSGLESAGVSIAARRAFPDHHRYTARDLDRLAGQAQSAGATALLTTEKDAVRLASLQAPMPIHAVALRIEIEDETAAVDWLLRRLNQP
jgi:tetraacyldisaccharide 4'-kinase